MKDHPVSVTSYSPPNSDNFNQRILPLAERIDQELTEFLSADHPVPGLHDGMAYSLGLDTPDRKARGKRIRPVLCLLTAQALGSTIEKALAFACAIELLHNFALVHDDIEDGDVMRRGRPATYIHYGMAHGINIGDFLFAKVFRSIIHDHRNDLETRHRLMEVLDETHEQLFVGQALDIGARDLPTFDRANYQRIVSHKTGSYLAAPLLGGAIVAGAGGEILTSLRQYGEAIGPLFQIKDDLIDLTSGKGREHIGNDIREGKRSFLVAAALEKASSEERGTLLRILNAPREDTTPGDVEWTCDLFTKTGAFDEARNQCDVLHQQGRAALKPLPHPLRETLETVTEVLVDRTD